jgi:hypothetical protein
MEEHARLAEQLRGAPSYFPSGALQWADAANEQRLADNVERLRLLGYPAHWVTPEEATQIAGDLRIPAAITMGAQDSRHTLAALDLQPDELLARLSDTTARLLAGRAALPPMDPLIHEPLTADCAIAIYDPVELTCTIARAGLPEPVLILPDGTSSTLPVPPGPPLAAVDTATRGPP